MLRQFLNACCLVGARARGGRTPRCRTVGVACFAQLAAVQAARCIATVRVLLGVPT